MSKLYRFYLPEETAVYVANRAIIAQAINEAVAIVIVSSSHKGKVEAAELAQRLVEISKALEVVGLRARESINHNDAYPQKWVPPLDASNVRDDAVRPFYDAMISIKSLAGGAFPTPSVLNTINTLCARVMREYKDGREATAEKATEQDVAAVEQGRPGYSLGSYDQATKRADRGAKVTDSASRMYEALRDIVGMCHGGDERFQRIAEMAEAVIKLHEDEALSDQA